MFAGGSERVSACGWVASFGELDRLLPPRLVAANGPPITACR